MDPVLEVDSISARNTETPRRPQKTSSIRR